MRFTTRVCIAAMTIAAVDSPANAVDVSSSDASAPTEEKVSAQVWFERACDPPVWLAVATTNLGFAMRAGARFSELLNWRVFQHRVMGGASST
jgi:hypothetical protein